MLLKIEDFGRRDLKEQSGTAKQHNVLVCQQLCFKPCFYMVIGVAV